MTPQPLLERAIGRSEIGFKRRGEDTVLDTLYQSGSAKIRLARAEPGRLTEAVLINTSGGLTDGDKFSAEMTWRAGTTAIVTTQAAERYYQARKHAEKGKPAKRKAHVTSKLTIEEGACALWLPQEAIMFNGAAYERETLINMAPSATLLAIELSVFGRAAMGETVTSGNLREIWQIRRGSKLIFADAFALAGDIDAQLMRPSVANGARAIATLALITPQTEQKPDIEQENIAHYETICETINALIAAQNITGRASRLGPLTLTRLFAPDAQSLRRCAMDLLTQLMPLLTQPDFIKLQQPAHTRSASILPPTLLPRVWSL